MKILEKMRWQMAVFLILIVSMISKSLEDTESVFDDKSIANKNVNVIINDFVNSITPI